MNPELPSFTVRWLLLFAIFFVAGCASQSGPSNQFGTQVRSWQGRIAVRIQTSPVQAFSSAFELRGSPEAGTLTLTSALGTTMAKLRWDAQGAHLGSQGSAQQFESLDALTSHVIGTTLPVSSLFSWLQGQDTPTPTWSAELQGMAEGRLTARRLSPEPVVELKIILER